MALDHARDFFHAGAMTFSPTDLARTTPLLFTTRWVTHICAPVFSLLAGVGAWLRLQRPGETRASLSRYLVSRGLWLIVLELVVMRVAMNFSLSMAYPPLLLVLWVLGLSMLMLAALVWLPPSVVLAGSLVVIVGHNLLDPIRAADLGQFAGVWRRAARARRAARRRDRGRGRLSAGAVVRGDGGGVRPGPGVCLTGCRPPASTR